MGSSPVTRRVSGCQTGRTPSSARISPASSPWVRIAAVPHTTIPTVSGYAPSSAHVTANERRRRAARRRRRRGRRAAPWGRRSRGCDRSAGRRRARASGSPTGPPGRARRASPREQVGHLVGGAQQPRHDLRAGEAQRTRDAGVRAAQHRLAHVAPRRRARTPSASERRHQRGLRRPQAVEQRRRRRAPGPGKRSSSSGGARRPRRPGSASEPGSSRPNAAPIAPPQARGPARRAREPQDRRQQAVELLAVRHAAEDVQAVADLSVLDLAQVAVDVLDQLVELVRAGCSASSRPRSRCSSASCEQRPDRARASAGSFGGSSASQRAYSSSSCSSWASSS